MLFVLKQRYQKKFFSQNFWNSVSVLYVSSLLGLGLGISLRLWDSFENRNEDQEGWHLAQVDGWENIGKYNSTGCLVSFVTLSFWVTFSWYSSAESLQMSSPGRRPEASVWRGYGISERWCCGCEYILRAKNKEDRSGTKQKRKKLPLNNRYSNTCTFCKTKLWIFWKNGMKLVVSWLMTRKLNREWLGKRVNVSVWQIPSFSET